MGVKKRLHRRKKINALELLLRQVAYVVFYCMGCNKETVFQPELLDKVQQLWPSHGIQAMRLVVPVDRNRKSLAKRLRPAVQLHELIDPGQWSRTSDLERP